MDINYFKNSLEEEKNKLEKQLSEIASPNAKDPSDWETDKDDLNVMTSDKNELADVFEESANKEAIEFQLEDRLNKVKAALQNIENGTYGICKEGCKIDEKRLKANPAADTCVKHSQ